MIEEHKPEDTVELPGTHHYSGQNIVITGASGLLGNAFYCLCRTLFPHAGVYVPRRSEVELRDHNNVDDYIRKRRPALVIHAAGTVGGIQANRSKPWKFLYNNAQMALNVIEVCRSRDVPQCMFMGSACIYPATVASPIDEPQVWQGQPQIDNLSYAAAKLLGVEAIRVCHEEGRDYTAFMPCNLYGPGDNYHPTYSHVIPGLFRRIAEAAENGASKCQCWGDGTPARDFIYAYDAALMVLRYCARQRKAGREPLLNITSGEVETIKTVAELIRNLVAPQITLCWEKTQLNNGHQTRFLHGSRYNACMLYAGEGLPVTTLTPLADGLTRVWQELKRWPTTQWKDKDVTKG